MMLPHMVLEIGELWKAACATNVVAAVRLLTRVGGPNMNIEAILLRESLVACRTLIAGEMRIAMVDNQTLLSRGNLLRASRHAATPYGGIVNKREREGCGRNRHS